jgi:aryl-alcohol dehydrogenase-like predicted oxidoreductase
MTKRTLGNSDLLLTPIGFGCWALGGGDWQAGWGSQDDNDSVAAIHRALELGINWIDTAPSYGLGRSEEVVGRALSEWKGARPYLFTKCSVVWNEKRELSISLKAASVRKELERSLQRIGTDVIDLYQIHWPVEVIEEIEEGWAELAKLKTEGKIRWIGVSNFNLEQLRQVQKIAPVTSLQPPYSLIRRKIETEILPWCSGENVGVIAYSPMASGLLTGAMTRERAAALPANDWRSRDAEFKDPKLTLNLALVERLRGVGQRHGRSPGEIAIAWALRNPAVTGAIVGARRAGQVDGFIHGGDVILSPGEIAEIEGDSITA